MFWLLLFACATEPTSVSDAPTPSAEPSAAAATDAPAVVQPDAAAKVLADASDNAPADAPPPAGAPKASAPKPAATDAPAASTADAPKTAAAPAPPAGKASPNKVGKDFTRLARDERQAGVCVSDADCRLSSLVDGSCCPTLCGPSQAYNKDFLASLGTHQQFNCAGKDPVCPTASCAPISYTTRCDAGVCVAVAQ